MANIKFGAEIKEMHDVQNIVTSCILGAQSPFTMCEMTDIAEKKLGGSSIKLTRKELHKLVVDTTQSFVRIKLVTAYEGKFYAYPTESVVKALK